MEADISVPAQSVILYPQSTLTDDHGTQLQGFVELTCHSPCKVDAVRVRLLGFGQTIADEALVTTGKESKVSVARYRSAPQMFLMREVMLRDARSNEPVEHDQIRFLDKGKHVFTFSIEVPRQMPASQSHALRKVYYELVFFIRARTVKKWINTAFTHAPSKVVVMECHPSKQGTNQVNEQAIAFQPAASTAAQSMPFRVVLKSKNARFGGCFTLVIEYDIGSAKTKIVVDDIILRLEQYWTVNDSRIEATKIHSNILQMSNFVCSTVHQPTQSGGGPSVEAENVPSSDSSASQTPLKRVSHLQGVAGQAALASEIQTLIYESYFPDSNGVSIISPKVGADLAEPLRTWQASTPHATKDEVKVQHVLVLDLSFRPDEEHSVEAEGQRLAQKATFRTPIYLVKEAMRTDAIQLPTYSVEPDAPTQPPAVKYGE